MDHKQYTYSTNSVNPLDVNLAAIQVDTTRVEV